MTTTTPIPMLDLMFFLTESIDNPRHVGSVLILRKPRRGGAQAVQQIVDAYRAASPRAPFNRIPVFLRSGRPLWHELAEVDARQHVMHLALPSPGTDRQLHELVAELHAPMLERDRPGWQVYVIDGLADDRFAIYHKCHHALIDGESGMEILRRSLAESPTDRSIRPPAGLEHPTRSRPAPRALQQRLERDARLLARRTRSIGVGSLYLVEQVLDGLRGYAPGSIRSFTAPHTPMNEPICNARAVTHTVLPLDGMKAIAHRTGTTLNDVTLCLIDAAMHRCLRERGRVPDRPLVALCPVSLRDEGIKEATTNVSAIWPPLGPVNARIDRRLQSIAANTRAAKAQLKSLGKDVAYAYAVMAFAVSEALAIARPEFIGMRPANVLVSNVRGPVRPLYLNGARLEALFPVSTLLAGIGLNVTFMSYARQVVLGFTANGAALPEVERLGRYVDDAYTRLERATATARHPSVRHSARRPEATV